MSAVIHHERGPLLTRIRLFAVNKLGGVDRVSAQRFAHDFMQPNGRAQVTVTADNQVIEERTFQVGVNTTIAVAPWARNTVIRECTFLQSQPTAILDRDATNLKEPQP